MKKEKKSLEKMSLKELWQLFPISLTAHRSEWKDWYDEEKKNILSAVPYSLIGRISHVGSTAVPGIMAKNIVDVLIEVKSREDIKAVKDSLTGCGWLSMSEEEVRVSLNKGYTPQGFAKKVFHAHIRLFGDNDELYFRDYLIENPNVAVEYEKLKLFLWKKFEFDRNAYTEAKGEFIRRHTVAAKRLYCGRY